MQSSSRIFSAASVLVCAVLWAARTSPVAAHHSLAAFYDMNAETEIEGRITSLKWVNPHTKIYVAVSNGQTWEVEAGPVNLLQRMKIEKTMLQVGETVRMRGNPGRENARTLLVSNILRQDRKTEMLVTPGAKPYRPWASTILVGNPDPVPGNPAARGEPNRQTAGGRSIFGTWQPTFETFPKRRGEPALTAAGQRAQSRYGLNKQVIAKCEVPGMPFAMMSPYPIAFVRQGDRLLMYGEAYDLMRVVYLAAPATPPAPSPLGVSVGRVTGDELVIETSRINYHSYGDLGPAQSNQSHVVERFTLSADGGKLDYQITITDPVMLAKPWSRGGSFLKKGELKKWYCDVDRD